MALPNDPMILLSYVNTQLRDFYPSLEEMCKSLSIEQETLCKTLAGIDYQGIIEEMYQAGELPCKDKREGKRCFEEFGRKLL